MAGVAAAAAEDLLAVGEAGAHQAGLGGPAAVQLGQPPALAVGQGPGGGVGAQQLHGVGALVVEGDPALDDIAAHAVVQGDAQPRVVEPQPEFTAPGPAALEGPLGTAPFGGAHGQRGPYEAGAALDGVLLVPVEPGLEGVVVRQRPGGQGLGVGELDAWAPVQVAQFAVLGEMDGVTARGPGQQPRTAVVSGLKHASPTDPNRSAQAWTSSGWRGCRATPVDNSLPQEAVSYGRSRARRRAVTAGPKGRSSRDAGPLDRARAGRSAQLP